MIKGIEGFALKQDVNNALCNLNAQIRKIFDILMTVKSNPKEVEDAMFSKKPLTGNSCASCEKKILNMSTTPSAF